MSNFERRNPSWQRYKFDYHTYKLGKNTLNAIQDFQIKAITKASKNQNRFLNQSQ